MSEEPICPKCGTKRVPTKAKKPGRSGHFAWFVACPNPDCAKTPAKKSAPKKAAKEQQPPETKYKPKEKGHWLDDWL